MRGLRHLLRIRTPEQAARAELEELERQRYELEKALAHKACHLDFIHKRAAFLRKRYKLPAPV